MKTVREEFKIYVNDGTVEFPGGSKYSLESVAQIIKWAVKARKKHLAGKPYLIGFHFDLVDPPESQNKNMVGECA